jgi:hypothetical protein
MKTAFNTMVKNESIMLDSVLPIWSKYPIDLFIFYDDNSTDETCNIIKKHLSNDRYIILNDHLEKFNEGYYRQKMIDESISNNVDIIFSIDADELLSSSIINDFDNFLKIYEKTDLWLYWYNAVNDSLDYHRADPSYVNNYRSFVLPVKHINRLDTSAWQYHTPRTPHVNLPKSYTKEFGVIHLQSCNKKYYALKQLWYKHYEFKYYNNSVESINQKYDVVVNNLNFNPTKIDSKLIKGIVLDLSFFDGLAEIKGYKQFIDENYNEQLITFGKEFL